MLKTAIVCVALITVVQSGIFDDVKGAASDVGEFFTNKFNDVKSLFANNEAELEKNVQRVKELLATISEKAAVLKPLANDAQKAALDRVGEMTNEIDQFQAKLKSQAGQTFEEKKTEWEKLVQNLFQKQGLDKLIALVQGNANGVATVFTSMLSFVVPLLLILRY